MQELEDAHNGEPPKTLRLARLIEMIAMDNEIIATHLQHNSPSILVTQYTELRTEHLAELSELLKGTGIVVQLTARAAPATAKGWIDQWNRYKTWFWTPNNALPPHGRPRVAKLFRLIEMDSEIIEQYRTNGVNDAHVQQYVDLKNKNLERLAELLNTPKLNIYLSFDKAA